MPFGLRNAPAIFQSTMDNIFHYLLDKVYLYHIPIYTESVDQHIPLVQEVLSRLEKANLGVKSKQSPFHIKKVKFLSYKISEQGIEMSEKKIEEVRNWVIPRKVKDVQ